jgi:ArsR family transcriptional regulator, arsenate/arsenite/antimonite-responsive transcriptional repressor
MPMRDPVTFFRSVADSTRWRIVQLLRDRALCVCELAEVLDLPQSTLSSHLRVIQKADLLDCERREKWLYYRLKPEWVPLLRSVDQFFPLPGQMAKDARSAEKRIAVRVTSCCPAPVLLAKTKSRTLKK